MWRTFWITEWLVVGAWLLVARAAAAEPAESLPSPSPLVGWTIETAVQSGLVRNPDLIAIRQQHGIAAGAVVTARTYPFNPVYETRVRHAGGPESAGITNRVSQEHTLLLEVELHRQRCYRTKEAAAALRRTDWDIATQELALAVRVIRAFDGVLYREDKLRLIEQTVALNTQVADTAGQLLNAGRLRGPDLVLARAEVSDARASLAPGRTLVVTAEAEFRRALGLVDEPVQLNGTLERPVPEIPEAELTQVALERRPDLHSRQAAVAEADARLRLEIANRLGNPTIGPTYELDPTRVSLLGAQLTVPLPAWNRHRGEILQRQAERTRAALELREAEIAVRQDVHAAVQRLGHARTAVETFRNQVLPQLEAARRDMETLFRQGDPGVDVLRVLEVQRHLLRTRDAYLDALKELSDARADLAAAVADPALAYAAPVAAAADAK